MEQQASKAREILAINVDLSCDHRCEMCEKFFNCTSTIKLEMYERGRMARAREVISRIKHKVAIVSGKGGVGKSIVTANLAVSLALMGKKVSILDQDFDGASIPKMLGMEGKRLTIGDDGIIPVEGPYGIQVISMGLILKSEEVLTWYHVMRRGATEEFLSHVAYGDRDYLLIDLPPGTSSDSMNIMQYIPQLDGAIVITIPSSVSQNVAKKAGLLCKKAKVKVFGIIENMSGYVCPHCGKKSNILSSGGGIKLAKELDVPFLGKIPLDARLSRLTDKGKPFAGALPKGAASIALRRIAAKLDRELNSKNHLPQGESE